MYRLEDLSRVIREVMPAAATEPLGVVTALGGSTFLLFALSLLFWLDERRSTATVVSYTLIALAVVITVKAALGLPRPPAAVRLIELDADPHGFPSGHAVASVVVYGGLASVRDRLTDRRVAAGVVAVVVLVSFSRVALGMHYLGDVIVGGALGIALLAACRYVVGTDAFRGFALATAVSVPALVVTGFGQEALLACGGSLGGAVGSRWLDTLGELRSRLHGGTLVVTGIPFVFVTDEFAEAFAHPALVVTTYAVLVAGILVLPAIVERVPLESVRRTVG